MSHSTKQVVFTASITLAALVMGCQPGVPDNDMAGGIVSGNEVINNREKMHQQNAAVVSLPATSADAAHPVATMPMHSTTAPAGAAAAPAGAPAAPADAAPAAPTATPASPADATTPAAPVAPGTPAAPAPVAPQ